MKTYTIQEISQMFHIPSSTLRYYEDIKLLPEVERTKNGQRIYTEKHIARLNSIHCFKSTGLPIAKMQDFFLYECDIANHIDDIIKLVDEHEKNIENDIEKLQENLLHIQQKLRYYNGIKKAIDENRPWPCWEDFSSC